MQTLNVARDPSRLLVIYLDRAADSTMRRQQSGSLPESGPENYLTLQYLISGYIAGA